MRTTAIALAIATVLSVAGCDRFGAPEPSGRVPVLQFDKPVSGEIASRNGTNFNDGSHHQLYQITLQDKQRVGITLTGALSGAMTVFHDGKVVARSRATDEGSSVAVAFRADGGGSYQVAVNASGPDTYGPFRLRAEQLKPYDGKPIINTGHIADLLLETSQTYTLQVDSAGLYTIDLRSDVFDTLLALEGEGQDAENDDGGEGSDSRISLLLQPGRYTLSVSALDDEDSGAFTLDVQRSKVPATIVDQDGTPLPASGSVFTVLDADGRRRFLLSLDAPARVQVDALSSQVDTVLRVVGGDIDIEDDDGGSGTDARLQETLPAGHYTVDVSSIGGDSGLVELRIQR
ncbi:ABC transporter substrate-binding protein [Stenotrophomonas sp.]|uniref:ABC transporter substrate-binding protein n=1 Tax=Stenotrophomonas sp. TaxID=69392 RepID=UPI0028ACD70A|nr:ABC transporter substrate-binding protein [Stenotrophomonas sp.]